MYFTVFILEHIKSLTLNTVQWLSLLQKFIQRIPNPGSAQVQIKYYSRGVRDSRWWRSQTMVPAGNNAKRYSSVNHTTKTIHHHLHNRRQSPKISNGTIIKNSEILKFIPDHLKTKKMCKHAVNKLPFVIIYVPDLYKT